MRPSAAFSRWSMCFAALCCAAFAQAGEVLPPEAELIAPGAPTTLGPGQGLVLLAFQIPDEMKAARFSVKDQRKIMFSHSVVAAGRSEHLWRVPEGAYCLENFYSGRYRFERRTNEMLCFTVRAGAINLPGTFSWLSGWTMRSATARLAFEPDRVVQVVDASYPQLWSAGLRWSFGDADAASLDMDRAVLLAEAGLRRGSTNAFGSIAGQVSGAAARARGDAYRTAAWPRQDPTMAFRWYEHAASLGEARAAALACQQSDLGIGVEVDAARAAKLCRAGAEGGDPVAAWWLERLHVRGRVAPLTSLARSRTSVDELELARTLFDATWGFRDAAGTHPDAEAMFGLAAVRAAAGDVAGIVVLADCHALGIGTPVDGERALQLLRTAAGRGSSIASLRMARMFWSGKVIARDLVEARRHFEMYAAADRRNVQELVLFLATVADPAVRDGARAVALQKELIAQVGESAAGLEALAAAHAAAGEFEAAMRMQGRASLKALREGWPDSEFERIKARHALYKAGQVLIQTP